VCAAVGGFVAPLPFQLPAMKSVMLSVSLLLLGLCVVAAEHESEQGAAAGSLRGGLFAALRQRKQKHAAAPVEADTSEEAADVVSDSPPANETTAANETTDDEATAEAAAQTAEEASTIDPTPEDSSQDGFPALPAVSAMTDSAAETLKSVNSQALVLEARLAQTQKENQEKLAKQKAIFEERLKTQEQGNRVVVSENADINASIDALREGNANLTNHAKELRAENRLKRSELQTLKAKIGLASEFVAESLKATDEQGVAALAVLNKPVVTHGHKDIALVATSEHDGDKKVSTHGSWLQAKKMQAKTIAAKQDDEDSDGDEDDDDDDEKSPVPVKDDDSDDDRADSFLALSSKVHRVSTKRSEDNSDFQFDESLAYHHKRSLTNPRDLISSLYSGVDTLSKQGDANAARLKALFVGAFKKGGKRHSALLVRQKALNATREGLQNTQERLQKAVSHLDGTFRSLDGRLQGLGNFLRRLGHLGAAPDTEAKRIMKTLPTKILLQKAPRDNNDAAASASTDAGASSAEAGVTTDDVNSAD